MAYAERRKGKLTGRWVGEIDERYRGGTRRRRTFATLGEAEDWEARERAGTAAPPTATVSYTFRDATRDALAAGGPKGKWKRDRDPSLRQRLDYCCEVLGDTPIDDVDYVALQRIVTSLERRPGRAKGARISGDTINRYLTAASAVLTWARKAKKRTAPAPDIPWQAKNPRNPVWLTEAKEDALVAHILQTEATAHAADVALTIRILSRTGLRWGEFATLEPAQVEILEAPDGTQEAWIRLWKTKTDSPRSVPIDVEYARLLRAMLTERRVPRYDIVRRAIKSAAKACGESPKLAVHALRHSTATRLVVQGENLAVVKEFLGHRALSTTLLYTQVGSDLLRQAAKKLSPARGGNDQELLAARKAAVREVSGNTEDLEATAGIEPAYTVLQTER